jgi:AcrR family transcriptional regulator
MRTVNPVRYAAQEGKILDAAQRFFAEKGYKETCMKDVADECGLTKASLYHYFSGKDSILLEILNRRLKGFNLDASQAWEARDLQEALVITANEYFDLVRQSNTHEFMAILLSEGTRRKEIGELIQRINRQLQDHFLEGVVGQGLIRPEDEESFRVPLYVYFGSLFQYVLDMSFFGRPMVKISQGKFVRYVAALTVENWKRALTQTNDPVVLIGG